VDRVVETVVGRVLIMVLDTVARRVVFWVVFGDFGVFVFDVFVFGVFGVLGDFGHLEDFGDSGVSGDQQENHQL
jgi:hypothetical protein